MQVGTPFDEDEKTRYPVSRSEPVINKISQLLNGVVTWKIALLGRLLCNL